jgi:sigma-B regulation protein RsbU (phosphoserine phosphatase)
LFRASIQSGLGPAGVLALMNRELCRDNEQFVFVTAAVGRLAFATGEVTLGDAGHNPVLLIGSSGRAATPHVPKCMALGVIPDTPYTDGQFVMSPGETLVLHTDGVTDARNPAGDMFGFDQLVQVVEQAGGESAESIAAYVNAAVVSFVAEAPPEDDLTLLVVRRT